MSKREDSHQTKGGCYVEVLNISQIDESRFGSRAKKARKLAHSVKIVYATSRHIMFEVYDPESKKTHTVLYLAEKKYPLCWHCDCTWYALHNDFCAHILAVHIYIQLLAKKKDEQKTASTGTLPGNGRTDNLGISNEENRGKNS